ncbi:DUF2157 domain-containing protein [Flavobacteriaceae bacterium M23B6Z8]
MKTKIIKDLAEMVSEGVISSSTADDIKNWYVAKKIERPNRLLLISGVLGALLTGLGIILILAHNWDSFSRFFKTILAFIPLAISQGLAVYALKKENETWKEAAGVLLFFSIGTAISLVSQIYHISGSLDSLLFTWILLGAPLIYLLKSKSLILLHLIFSTWWLFLTGYGYRSDIPWFYLVFFSWIIPFYVKFLKGEPEGNFTGIVSWLLPFCFTISLGAFVDRNDHMGFLLYMLAFGIMYLIGISPQFREKSPGRNGFIVFGMLGMITLLLITSFQDLWKDLNNLDFIFGPEFYLALVLLMILVALVIQKIIKYKTSDKFLLIPFLFTFIFFIGIFNGLLATILINITILIVAILLIRKGALTMNLGMLNFGLLVVSALIVCRFFDTDLSFVLRGILFLIIGAGFFIANYIMIKRKPQSELDDKSSKINKL